MKHKLIMVEGIPGSGKTTFAKKIAARLRDLGYNATCYNESDIHPADLSWIAVLTAAQYEHLLQKWPSYADQIRAQAWQESNRVLVAYSNVEVTRKEDEALYDDFAPYEVTTANGRWPTSPPSIWSAGNDFQPKLNKKSTSQSLNVPGYKIMSTN